MGLPLLIYDAITGEAITVASGNVLIVAELLLLSMLLFFACVFLPQCFTSDSDEVEVDLEIGEDATPAAGVKKGCYGCRCKPVLHFFSSYVLIFAFLACNLVFFVLF